MKCKLCHQVISAERLEVLPDTRLCVKCSQEVGGDYEVTITEENLGDSIVSVPVVQKVEREFD